MDFGERSALLRIRRALTQVPQGVAAWPVAKLLEFALGPHHGIIYRRAELKELIAMHSNGGQLGGDLKTDTVTIIGGALDLQEKVRVCSPLILVTPIAHASFPPFGRL